MIKYRILIVDDDRDDIELLCATFQEEGVKEVHGVKSMRYAIEFLDSIDDVNDFPALIITDLNMPCNNGYDLLKFLKASPKYRNIPVIVLSTSLSAKEIETSLDLGALGYFSKPALQKEYTDLIAKIKLTLKNES